MVSQGGLDELRRSGYDLASLTQELEKVPKLASDKKNMDAQSAIPDENGGYEDDASNDEFKQSYSTSGWRPCKFWAHIAGLGRVGTWLMFAVMWIAIGLGTNLNGPWILLPVALPTIEW
jgi:hypothetical protein